MTVLNIILIVVFTALILAIWAFARISGLKRSLVNLEAQIEALSRGALEPERLALHTVADEPALAPALSAIAIEAVDEPRDLPSWLRRALPETSEPAALPRKPSQPVGRIFVGLLLTIGLLLAPWFYGFDELGLYGFLHALIVLALGLWIARRSDALHWAFAVVIASFLLASLSFIELGGAGLGMARPIAFSAYAVAAMGLAPVILQAGLWPQFGGNGWLLSLRRDDEGPVAPVRILSLIMVVNIVVFGACYQTTPPQIWLSLLHVTALAAMCFFWLSADDALAELGFVPLLLSWLGFAIYCFEAAPSNAVIVFSFAMLAIIFSLCAAIGSGIYEQNADLWMGVALLYAPAFVAIAALALVAGHSFASWSEFLLLNAGFAFLLAAISWQRLGADALATEVAALVLLVYALLAAATMLAPPDFALAMLVLMGLAALISSRFDWRLFEIAFLLLTPIGFVVLILNIAALGVPVVAATLTAMTVAFATIFRFDDDAREELHGHLEAWAAIFIYSAIALVIVFVISIQGQNPIGAHGGLVGLSALFLLWAVLRARHEPLSAVNRWVLVLIFASALIYHVMKLMRDLSL